jgi:hypothetical protein
MELQEISTNDLHASNLNDQTVRLVLYHRGQQEKDFARNEKTPERVQRWVKRMGGSIDLFDVQSVLRQAL